MRYCNYARNLHKVRGVLIGHMNEHLNKEDKDNRYGLKIVNGIPLYINKDVIGNLGNSMKGKFDEAIRMKA